MIEQYCNDQFAVWIAGVEHSQPLAALVVMMTGAVQSLQ